VSMLGEKIVLYQRMDKHCHTTAMLCHFIHFEIGIGCRAPRPLERHGEGKRRRLVAHETCRVVTLDWLHGMESWGRQRQSGRRGAWTIAQGMEIVSCGAVGIPDLPSTLLAGITPPCSSFSALQPPNQHAIQGRPAVAFAFVMYKFAYRLISHVLHLSELARKPSMIDEKLPLQFKCHVWH